MTEYTADDLERSVLDPLFYRYEKALRAQVRLERQLADRPPPLVQTVADQREVILRLEATVARLQIESRNIEPKLKALYDNAKEILIEITGGKQRKGMSVVAQRLQKPIDNLYTEVEIPF